MNNSTKISNISALEILDSRGIPTLRVKVELEGGIKAGAHVPSGTSSGKNEAHELRDGDGRYDGLGVQKAVKNIVGEIASALQGKPGDDQEMIDSLMLRLDGTPDKSRLGANAILGVSLACARAAARANHMHLYQYLREHFDSSIKGFRIPQPMFNLLNGGAHAESGMNVQEFMLVPKGKSFSEILELAAVTFIELRTLLRLGHHSTGVGHEGGFAPQLSGSEQALDILLAAAKQAGLGKSEIALALDVAASEFYDPKTGKYEMRREKKSLTQESIVEWYRQLVKNYPIISIEDGLAEEDWAGWKILHQALGKKIKIVGDDLTVTNASILQKAIDEQALNALIIKPNQIGTLTETFQTAALARKQNISMIVSHRSGETNDVFISDLAVALDAQFIKAGSVSRGERVAKYNRLLEIEEQLDN